MLMKPTSNIRYDDAAEFVRKNKLEKEFKKHFGVTLKEYEKTVFISDQEVIECLLSKQKGKHLLLYYEDDNIGGYFRVLGFSGQKQPEPETKYSESTGLPYKQYKKQTNF